MVRITRNNAVPSLVNVTWSSRDNFYEILNIVKSQVGAYRKARTWNMNIGDIGKVVKSVVNTTGENVMVDIEVYADLFDYKKVKKSTLELRNKLDGVDSGINLVNGYKLLPFQHVAVEFINYIKNGLIADKVGLGKTLSGICSAYKMYKNEEIKKVLIIVPATMKVKWQREIKKFLGEDAYILEAYGYANRSVEYRNWQKSDTIFLIASYDGIKRDVVTKIDGHNQFDHSSYFNEYTSNKFALIIDEIQNVRNTGTLRSKMCRSISHHRMCCARIGLSATYIETGLEDLFGVMNVIDESVFGTNWMVFENMFLKRNWFGSIDGYKNIEIAENKMRYVSIRRNKEQVRKQLNALLPKVNESTLWLDLTSKQKKMSKDIIEKCIEIMDDMNKEGKINVSTVLSEINYLRQVTISSELIDSTIKFSAKMDCLLELLPDIVKENKVVIFCFYTGFIDAMEREFNKAGMKCLAMHGGRPEGHSKNRQKMIDKFSKSKNTNILVSSDILKEGVDIPAASYVINTDILWNPAGMIQRCGRIDRLNQRADIIYNINLLCKNSIEEEMWARVYNRLELMTQIIDGGVKEKRHKKVTFKDLKHMIYRLGGR